MNWFLFPVYFEQTTKLTLTRFDLVVLLYLERTPQRTRGQYHLSTEKKRRRDGAAGQFSNNKLHFLTKKVT